MNVNPTGHSANDEADYLVEVTTASGKKLIWHKDGDEHRISRHLGEIWVTHFKPHLFQITPDGCFHPHGDAPTGMDVESVRLIPADQAD